MSKKTISIKDSPNKKLRVLSSENEFQNWYREQYDFSMFSEEEIKLAIQDDRPDNYPCIPLIVNNDAELLYLSNDFILHCVGVIFDVK
ncbi:hypothetical protein JW313_21590 [Enterobacter cloacae subsp. cloacae]|uniref:hypothetical protein n=1 Tax=Enterobacter cloacae TaxID=550 RepID=UPI001C5B4E06|nr:hypothetical protein [Enterobacter cloacae]MBW4217868.1 hypothetical protein [Enterobacter cloacae subsp. cloacae]